VRRFNDCKRNIKQKGNEVHSIPSTITVYEALRIMGERNVGAVLVIEDDNLKEYLKEIMPEIV
jgi:CBS domain-containing protein